MKDAFKFTIKVLTVLVILTFVATAYAYRVKIIPVNPDEDTYSMKINEEVAFIAKAYVGEEKGDGRDEEMLIRKIFWQFDYSYLQKIACAGNTVKLKALKEGRVNLMVTGIVDNYPFTKAIEITIEK